MFVERVRKNAFLFGHFQLSLFFHVRMSQKYRVHWEMKTNFAYVLTFKIVIAIKEHKEANGTISRLRCIRYSCYTVKHFTRWCSLDLIFTKHFANNETIRYQYCSLLSIVAAALYEWNETYEKGLIVAAGMFFKKHTIHAKMGVASVLEDNGNVWISIEKFCFFHFTGEPRYVHCEKPS